MLGKTRHDGRHRRDGGKNERNSIHWLNLRYVRRQGARPEAPEKPHDECPLGTLCCRRLRIVSVQSLHPEPRFRVKEEARLGQTLTILTPKTVPRGFQWSGGSARPHAQALSHQPPGSPRIRCLVVATWRNPYRFRAAYVTWNVVSSTLLGARLRRRTLVSNCGIGGVRWTAWISRV